MKTIFTIFLILFSFCKVQSQDLIVSSQKVPMLKSASISDSIFFNKQPAATLKLFNPLIKKGNNGNGFDVYQSQLDHMSVLIPDKSNSAANKMPNAIGYQNIYRQDPELKKRIDSLYKGK